MKAETNARSTIGRRWSVAWLLAGMMVLAVGAPVQAVDPDPDNDPDEEVDVTFTRDIIPILQANCQECHQPGSIAPMSLMSYEEVRPWAPIIRERVVERIMPPWHVNPHIGIQDFKNDVSLSEEEIETIVQWVDNGTPEGDPADLPAPVEFASGETYRMFEEFGEPDLVVQTTPFTVPATGNDQWWRPRVPTGLTEDRWVKAIEVLPAYPQGRKVTHHVLVSAIQEQSVGGLLTEWAIGKVGEVYAEGTGKLLQAGSELEFEVHYYPAGEEVVNDQVSVGIWFHEEGYEPEFPTVLRIFNVSPQSTLEIPPHSTAIYQNEYLMREPVRIQSFQPHMHLRGKGMSMEAIYPDGQKEMLSIVDNFQFNWHNNYIYADDAAPLLPAGTTLKFTVWFDNTENHASNPHPGDFVTWGDRAADEMGHAWVGVTTLSQEDYDRLVEEREALQSVAGEEQ